MRPVPLLTLLLISATTRAQWDEDRPVEVDARLLDVDRPLGQISGIAVDSQQLLITFHRAGRTWNTLSFSNDNKFNSSAGPITDSTIFVIDPESGTVVEEHGANQFLMPHGLTVDHKDNVWVTDVGLHQVFKFARGDLKKPLLTLGVAKEPGNDHRHFCKPTDVAVAKNGHFFVADGYCNSRIMKFDEKGELLAVFGSANSASPPLDGEFRTPHSLALIEDLDLLCVADRDNERIQCFSAGLGHRSIPTGIFFTKAENIGRIFAIREKEHYLIGVTGSDSTGLSQEVFVMDMDTGKANAFAKGIENAHALAVTSTGEVFIAKFNPNQIIQISL